MSFEEAIQLLKFEGYLLPNLIPHAGVLPRASGSG